MLGALVDEALLRRLIWRAGEMWREIVLLGRMAPCAGLSLLAGVLALGAGADAAESVLAAGLEDGASRRLGFRVRLPQWLPSGVSIGSVEYRPPADSRFEGLGETTEKAYRRPDLGGARYGFLVVEVIGGFRVLHVAAGSPAAAAGLRPGDLIVRSSGIRLRNVLLPGGPIGARGTLWYERRGRLRRADLRLRPWRAGKEPLEIVKGAPRARIWFEHSGNRNLMSYAMALEEWRTDAGFVDTLALARPRTVRVGGRVYTIAESALRQTVVLWTSNGIGFRLTCQPFGDARVPTDLLLRIARSVPD